MTARSFTSVDPVEAVADGEVVDEPVGQAVGVEGSRSPVADRLDCGEHEDLEAADASEVTARIGSPPLPVEGLEPPGPDELQRIGAVEVHAPCGRQIEPGRLVAQGGGDLDVEPTDQVDEAGEAGEVDGDDVVDRDADVGLDDLDEPGKATGCGDTIDSAQLVGGGGLDG